MQQITPQDYSSHDSRVRLGSLTGFQLNRRFTDLFCCLNYLILLGSCIGLVLFYRSYAVPQFNKLRDSDHNICKNPYNFLYYPTASLQRSICVKNCPNRAGKLMQCEPNSQFQDCPVSISGLVANYELGICHHPDAEIPLSSMSYAIDKSIFSAKGAILNTLGIVSLLVFIIVFTTLIYPDLVYLYVTVFQSIMIVISFGCFFRYFVGRLPFVDANPDQSYKGSLYTLGFGILFLLSSIISLTMLITRFPNLRFTIKIIKAARAVFFDNPLILVNSMILTILAIGALILNMWLFEQIQSFGQINRSSKGLDQYKGTPMIHLMRILFLIQVLWTHGLIISLSHFIFEAKATLWYYSQVLGANTLYSLFSTIKLVFWHFGTICFGSTYTYYSQTFTNAINYSQQFSSPADFDKCCYLHNSCFRYLSIYGFIPTILQGLPFWSSNNRFSLIKIAAQNTYNELYLQGSFFTNSGKFFITVFSTLIVYLQLVIFNPDLYSSFRVLAIPLLITAFVAHEIATIWLDSTGTVGDSILFNRVIENTFGQQVPGFGLRGNPLAFQILQQKIQMPVMPID